MCIAGVDVRLVQVDMGMSICTRAIHFVQGVHFFFERRWVYSRIKGTPNPRPKSALERLSLSLIAERGELLCTHTQSSARAQAVRVTRSALSTLRLGRSAGRACTEWYLHLKSIRIALEFFFKKRRRNMEIREDSPSPVYDPRPLPTAMPRTKFALGLRIA